jgi:23S rRNA (pseudouridine1915-N3)-methyltransferase
VRLHLVFVGKTAAADIDAALQRYLNRLQHYVPTEIHIIREEKILKGVSEKIIQERESNRILDLIRDRGYLLVWDRGGRQMDSPAFAGLLERLRGQGTAQVWMIIGGTLGVSPKLLERADQVAALSPMTFPHDLARLLVLEQLYRAFTIIRGEPYHK